MIQDMPGAASLRDLKIVGNGYLAKLFEHAGFYTIADLRQIDLDDTSDAAGLKRLQRSIDDLRDQHGAKVSDWGRIGRKAYNVILQVKDANVKEDDVPPPFMCPLSRDWIVDPVMTPAGQTYDKSHILRWINAAGSDPYTRQALAIDDLVPNRALRDAIAMYRPLEERYLINHSL